MSKNNPNTVVLTTKVTQGMYAQVIRLAAERGEKMTDTIRDLLNVGLIVDRKRKEIERTKAAETTESEKKK